MPFFAKDTTENDLCRHCLRDTKDHNDVTLLSSWLSGLHSFFGDVTRLEMCEWIILILLFSNRKRVIFLHWAVGFPWIGKISGFGNDDHLMLCWVVCQIKDWVICFFFVLSLFLLGYFVFSCYWFLFCFSFGLFFKDVLMGCFSPYFFYQ